MRVALVTWGDPSGWSSASYSGCPGDAGNSEGYSVLSCIDADRILLFVQDSVIVPTTRLDRRNDVYRKCVEHTICCRHARDYGEWLDEVKGYVKCMVGQMAPRIADRISVLVLPSEGEPKDEWCELTSKFTGRPDLMYAVGLLQAYRGLIDDTKDDGQMELMFDMTHGVNYLTHIVARIARDVAGVLSIGRAQVRVDYRGAVPIVMNRHYEMTSVLPAETPRISPDAYDDAGLDEWTKLTKFALRANAPLLLLKSFEGSGLEDLLEGVPDQLGTIANIRWNGDSSVTVDYAFKRIPAVMKKPGAAYMSILRDAIRRRLVSARGSEYSLASLNRIKDEVFSRISELAYMIVEAELENLNRAAESLGDGDCRRYQDLIKYECSAHPEARGPEGQGGQEPRTEGRGGLPRDLRNFVAHAGLLKELTYVCKRNQEIYLRYNDDELCKFLESQGEGCPWASSVRSAQGSP
ncbi:MAG: TM1812 family CRISPR-associated protein [Conexivisphaera sp.]